MIGTARVERAIAICLILTTRRSCRSRRGTVHPRWPRYGFRGRRVSPIGPCRSLRSPKERACSTGALDCDDTRVMVAALETLGIAVKHDFHAASIAIEGCGGRFPARAAALDLANSGTSLRFLAAMLATAEGTFHLDGSPGCASGRSPTCSLRSRAWAPVLDPTSETAARRSPSTATAWPVVMPGSREMFPVSS